MPDPATGLDPVKSAPATAGADSHTTVAVPALGIDAAVLADGPLGVVSLTLDERDRSTLIPSGTAIAATWSAEIARELGLLLGGEARERGIDVLLGPNLGVPRNPFSGRAFEMYSEEVLLTGRLAAAMIGGIQAQGVAASPKHLVANDTETGRRAMNSAVSTPVLRETYLVPFEFAAKRGARAMMTAYNRLNGVPCVANPRLVDVVKREWGWDGVLTSDWFGIEDGPASANAGVDLEMPGPARHFGSFLAGAVERGEVTPERLEDMIRRIRALSSWLRRRQEARSADADAVLVKAATMATTLLKNDQAVLPVVPGMTRKIAVIGPLARRLTLQGGTFGRVAPARDPADLVTALAGRCQGTSTEIAWAQGIPVREHRPLASVRPRTPSGERGVLVTYEPAGEAAREEVRTAASFVWFHRIPRYGSTRTEGRVRVRAVVEAPATGRYEFGVAGTGQLRLEIDGREVVTRPAPAPADVMGVVARSEPERAWVDLEAGDEVVLAATADFEASHVQALSLTVLTPQDSREAALGSAMRLVEDSDLAVVIVGDDESTSRESADLAASGVGEDQEALIGELTRTGKPVVVVVNASRAVDMPWADDAGAVLMSWYGGEAAAEALAGIIVGAEEPGGRLPVTIAVRDQDHAGWGQELDTDLTLDYDRSEPVGHAHFEATGTAPRFGFGHGLGYGRVTVDSVTIEQGARPGSVGVTVRSRNDGTRATSEVFQVYVRRAHQPWTRLAEFARVHLEAGETGITRLTLPVRAFAGWFDAGGAWVIDDGALYEVLVGRSSVDMLGHGYVRWDEPRTISTAADPDEIPQK
ncbi:glycoside hydrolase family 3 protein [Amycolatopsis acidicola]|uniref:Glycoside hydrolase family 3 protein n=1 Tax=Amycolatopsis acidicola TaxID=2596893 RepID=A0A5N0V6L9_9PSEU|nr:glycoside hydrolase family 3 C-terminal domain-containing protein [Amycolatopsis acidicola]KAA9160710.1 glycoside hydrolase family 3 protein [Amycolatopsis acidicola]